MTRRSRVLVFTPWFLPGQQGGGSVLAVRYLVEQLGETFEFVVATGDRDFGARRPYTSEEHDEACRELGIEIHHLPSGWRRIAHLWRLLRQPFDLVYLNSVLSPGLGLLPLVLRRLGRARNARLLIAPRGELHLPLLAMKAGRKRLYLGSMKVLRLFDNAVLHATSAAEYDDLRALGLGEVRLASDLTPTQWPQLPPPRLVSEGALRMAFVSRIDRNKNLAQVIRVLAGVNVAVQLDVAGPVGDAEYWAACQAAMATLPGHIQVRQLGALTQAEVLDLLTEQELFFLPTWSENHGYVIHEALLAGCALLISDRTPWRGLEQQGVGFDLALENDQAMADVITRFAGLPPAQRLAIRHRAQAYGLARLDGSDAREAMRRLLAGLA